MLNSNLLHFKIAHLLIKRKINKLRQLTNQFSQRLTYTNFTNNFKHGSESYKIKIPVSFSSFLNYKTLLFSLSILSFQGNAFSQCGSTAPSGDFDCDGVINSVDLDDDNDGIYDVVECNFCFDTFQNGSFENTSPTLGTATWDIFAGSQLPYWQTTEIIGGVQYFEIWSSGFLGVTAPDGNQFAEMNAYTSQTLYQTICLNGNSGTINWSIKHKGRDGIDSASISFGSTLSAAISATPTALLVDNSTSWGTHTGTYTIPSGQFSLVIAFKAISTSSSSVAAGNLIDDVKIEVIQDCLDSDGDLIFNKFDSDSDNDGCSDANEYYNSSTADGGDDGIYGTGTPSVDANGKVIGATYTGTYTNAITYVNISTQPTSQSIIEASNTSFSTSVSSGAGTVSYQWQVSTDGGATWNNISNGGVYSGATSATLTLTAPPYSYNGYRYKVIVSMANYICGSKISNVVGLTINKNSVTDTDGDGISDGTDLDDDNDGVLDNDECTNLCSATIVNGGFEITYPLLSPNDILITSSANVQGWETTENFNGYPEIEIWSDGFLGVPAAEGNQFAELNAFTAGTLYQSFCINGASGTVNWSLKHRGRFGIDVAALKFGSTITYAVSSAPISIFSDGNTAWGSYSGSFSFPSGLSNLVIGFQAISSSTGDPAAGNFLDDIQITIIEGCQDSDNDGIPNYQDTDSDNDACSDANEYYNSLTADGGDGMEYGTDPISEDSDGKVIGASYSGDYTMVIDADVSACEILLPIELLSFNAMRNNDYVDLRWQTASEHNNDYFTVERSEDGYIFNPILYEAGAGNSTELLNYATKDLKPLNGVSYYRLKQTDFDGAFDYSEIRIVSTNEDALVLIYPNPSTGVINISSNQVLNDAKIISADGKLIWSENVISELKIELANGVYYFMYEINHKTFSKKIVIIK